MPDMRGKVGDEETFRSSALAGSKDLQAPRWPGAKPGAGWPIFA